MKTVTIEDIYIKIESIFDDNEDDYERRLATYIMLNELLPKWEGNKVNIN